MTNPNASPAAAYRAGEVLIQFDISAKGAGQSMALSAVGGRFADDDRGSDDVSAVQRVALGEGVSVEHAIEILSKMPGVKFVEPDYQVAIEAVSNDTNVVSGLTWGLYGDVGSATNIYGSQATEAWAAGFTGSTKVAVGVADSGVDYTHPDLYQNIWLNQKEIPTALKATLRDVDGDNLISFRDLNNSLNASYVTDKNGNGRIDAGDLLNDVRWENGVDEDANGYKDDLVGWDFVNNDNDPMDDNGHGTHVAGTIAATGGNSAGVAGIGWNTQVVALKFLDNTGYGYTSNSIRALDYFTNASKAGTGVDFAATNNSWGGAGYSLGQLDAIVRGAQQQILYVAAAGNGGSDKIGDSNDKSAYYPASYSTLSKAGYEAVIAVAAINSVGALTTWSNYGLTSVDLGAPGNGIYSTMLGGGYGYKHGTSMATPHVAGAIALYSAAAPGASGAKVRADLLASTISTASLVGKTVTGGRLDVAGYLAKSGAAPGGGGGTSPGGVTLNGGTGNDLLTPSPSTGNDTVNGREGNDTLNGGAGADRLDGGIGSDALEGGDGADTLLGGEGGDTLDGGAGADRLEGGAASDTYEVDNAGDIVVEITGSTGGSSDKVLSSVSFTLPSNVERLVLTGTANINGTGNELANLMYGNGGANKLDGLGGSDNLIGGAGADTLNGGDGSDTLNGGDGIDVLNGGAGADVFLFARGQAKGDTIQDFAADDIIQLTGYSTGSTITKVVGTTDWLIKDAASGATEVLHLTNGYALTSGDFIFN